MLRLSAACLLAVLAACGGSEPDDTATAAAPEPTVPALAVPPGATCTVTAPPGADMEQAEILLDGKLLSAGASAQLPAGLTGRHVLRFRLPGCESKEVVVEIDPKAASRAIEVALAPPGAADADSPFVYDLY